MRKAPGFVIHEYDTISFHNRVCVSIVAELKKKILYEGPNTPHSIHPSENKLYKNLNHRFWWSNIKQEVADYIAEYLTCQRVKIKHQLPARLLQLFDVPESKWDLVSMDFMVGLPLTQRKNNVIWVVVDWLTKTGHFIAMRNTYTLDRLVRVYIKEIVRLHEVPRFIASNQDTRF